MMIYWRPVILILFLMCGCANRTSGTDSGSTATGAVSSTGISLYNCSSYGGYTNNTTCNQATLANCNQQTETNPDGTTIACYFPVSGWQSCATANANWLYTTWSVQCQVGTSTVMQETRSVITCSSNVCACLNPPVLTQTCGATGSCPSPAPSPLPTCAASSNTNNGGVGSLVSLAFTPNNYVFGTVDVGYSVTKAFQIKNTGSADATHCTLTSSDPTHFILQGSSSCSTIYQQTSCGFSVVASPTDVTPYTTALTVTCDGGVSVTSQAVTATGVLSGGTATGQ